MTNDEAKFLLNAYRPGGADARNPALAGALAQAKDDPGLGAWFGRSQAFDASMAARLRELAPPPGLRDAILAGAQASFAEAKWKRRPEWLAMAAAVAALFVVAFFWLAPGRGYGTVAQSFANFALGDLHDPGHIGDPDTTTRRWLSASTVPLEGGALPIDLVRMREVGCRALTFQRATVFEVCFARGGKEFHLYVLPRKTVRTEDIHITQIADGKEDAVAVWSDANYVYAVATQAGAAVLKTLL